MSQYPHVKNLQNADLWGPWWDEPEDFGTWFLSLTQMSLAMFPQARLHQRFPGRFPKIGVHSKLDHVSIETYGSLFKVIFASAEPPQRWFFWAPKSIKCNCSCVGKLQINNNVATFRTNRVHKDCVFLSALPISGHTHVWNNTCTMEAKACRGGWRKCVHDPVLKWCLYSSQICVSLFLCIHIYT